MVSQAQDPSDDAPARALARLRLRARRRAEWLRALWGDGALDRRGAPDDPDAERAFLHGDEASRVLTEAVDALERGPARGRLAHLAAVFGLDDRELDYVEACLALDVDPALGALLGYLADHPGRVYATEPVLARIYEHGLHRVLTPESALVRWRLIEAEPVGPGEPAALSLDPLIRDWLVGQHRLDAALVGRARLIEPRPALRGWPVDDTSAWVRATAIEAGERARLTIVGAPGAGRRTFAAGVAGAIGLPLLAIDVGGIADDAWPTVVLAAHRQAFLDGCAIAWCGEPARPWPVVPVELPVQCFVQDRGGAGAAGRTVVLPPLDRDEREAMWRAMVPGADAWPAEQLAAIASQHRVAPGDVLAIAARRPTGPDDAAALVRRDARERLGELARWMECPFTWPDLVLPDPLRIALEDLVFEARHRAAIWEQPAARRLFPQGRGLFALFSGSPGTGKTMAAQVIAATLGLDLFRISLAAVVSKYVGETSRNLERVLARADEMDAVLLFDEADALFGKRTEIKDAHDRFANTDTDHLLQAIEAYRGIVVLASNKKANIDAAFTRRLRWVLEFPRPDAAHRRALWGRLVAELGGVARAEQLAGSLDAVAAAFEVTGAQIKYAVLTALYAAERDAAPLDARHLLRGLERELAKEGRALTDRDRERIVHA